MGMKLIIPWIALAGLASCSVCGPYGSPEEMKVYPLQHADAVEVVRILKSDSAGLAELVADSRQNSIVAKGTREKLERLDVRVSGLDRPR